MSKEITNEEWTEKQVKIDAWFAQNEEYLDRKATTDFLFNMGSDNPDLRRRNWGTITGVFVDLPAGVSPIQKGRKSLMGTEIKFAFDAYIARAQDAYQADYENNEYLQAFEHIPSGFFNQQEQPSLAYAKYMAKRTRTYLNSAFNALANNDMEKSVHWDGSYDSDGHPALTHLEASEEE